MPRKKFNYLAKPPVYGRDIGFGMEGIVKPLTERPGLVHKIFHLDWISRKYPMGGNLRWVSRLAYSPVQIEIRGMQPPKRGGLGLHMIPAKQWEKLTLLMATHSADVLRKAKSLGARVPRVFRPVCVKGKSGFFWVLELSDLRRKDAELFSGEEFYTARFGIDRRSMQDLGLPEKLDYRKLKMEMDGFENRLTEQGYHYDINHDKYGSWLVRYYPEKNSYELFFVDASNWFYAGKA